MAPLTNEIRPISSCTPQVKKNKQKNHKKLGEKTVCINRNTSVALFLCMSATCLF